MINLREIQDYELLEGNVTNRHSYIFGSEYGYGSKIFELSIRNNIICLISVINSKPQIEEFQGAIVIAINNELQIIDKNSCKLICSYYIGASIYEFMIINNSIIVIADIEIICINSNYDVKWRYSFKDIIQDYRIDIDNELILCELESKSININMFNGKALND